MQNEFKLVKFNLPKEIQGDIQKIIDWNKQIKFDKLTEKIRDLEQKGASSNKNYLTLTLYKLLEIGHNTDKIQSALNQWKFLESHTLSPIAFFLSQKPFIHRHTYLSYNASQVSNTSHPTGVFIMQTNDPTQSPNQIE